MTEDVKKNMDYATSMMSGVISEIANDPLVCHGRAMNHEVVGDGDDEAEIHTCHYCSCTRDWQGKRIKD